MKNIITKGQPLLDKLLNDCVDKSHSKKWDNEILRLPSGRIGFIFMALEDAVSSFGYLRGTEIGDTLVVEFFGYNGEQDVPIGHHITGDKNELL